MFEHFDFDKVISPQKIYPIFYATLFVRGLHRISYR